MTEAPVNLYFEAAFKSSSFLSVATAPVPGSISERWAQLMGLPGGAAGTAAPAPAGVPGI
jgi:hypothetical protein